MSADPLIDWTTARWTFRPGSMVGFPGNVLMQMQVDPDLLVGAPAALTLNVEDVADACVRLNAAAAPLNFLLAEYWRGVEPDPEWRNGAGIADDT